MSRNIPQDVLGVLRGLQSVANAAVRYQESHVKEIWLNSSLRDAVNNVGGKVGSTVVHSFRPETPPPQVSLLFNISLLSAIWNMSFDDLWFCALQSNVSKKITEIVERTSMVTQGIRTFAAYAGSPSGK